MVLCITDAYSGPMSPHRSYQPLEILLVEDNQTFADAVKAFLEGVNGVKVVGHALNGPQAISLAMQLHPHLVLMDIGLGGMSGFDVAGLLLDLQRPPLVIFLSMHDGEAYRQKAKRMGADGFVSKANFAEELFPLIDTVIEKWLSTP